MVKLCQGLMIWLIRHPGDHTTLQWHLFTLDDDDDDVVVVVAILWWWVVVY